MNQTYLNTKEDCDWLRETHLAPGNLNNANPIPAFQSACLFGNEDCPREVLVYVEDHPTIHDKPARATLMDNGRYSFIRS